MNFKQVVREWLAAEGITQGILAHRMGITPQTLSGILAHNNPKLATLHRFARVMDVSLSLFEEPWEEGVQRDPAVRKIMNDLAAIQAYQDHERPARDPA